MDELARALTPGEHRQSMNAHALLDSRRLDSSDASFEMILDDLAGLERARAMTFAVRLAMAWGVLGIGMVIVREAAARVVDDSSSGPWLSLLTLAIVIAGSILLLFTFLVAGELVRSLVAPRGVVDLNRRRLLHEIRRHRGARTPAP